MVDRSRSCVGQVWRCPPNAARATSRILGDLGRGCGDRRWARCVGEPRDFARVREGVGDGPHLAWLTGDRILYRGSSTAGRISTRSGDGGEPTRLTSGSFMVEDVAQVEAGSFVVYNANTGRDSSDDDRRHLYRVGAISRLRSRSPRATASSGPRSSPAMAGRSPSLRQARGRRRSCPYCRPTADLHGRSPRTKFPPTSRRHNWSCPAGVVFRRRTASWYTASCSSGPGARIKPALIFVHGGPPRSMLLGWHYMDYYAARTR